MSTQKFNIWDEVYFIRLDNRETIKKWYIDEITITPYEIHYLVGYEWQLSKWPKINEFFIKKTKKEALEFVKNFMKEVEKNLKI